MTSKTLKTLALALCALLTLTAIAPVSAVPEPASEIDLSDLTIAKLTAFWHQDAYGGLNNGEAVYDHDWIIGANYFGKSVPEYSGGWSTVLVLPYNGTYRFEFTHEYFWTASFDDEDGNTVCVSGYDTITPDLYGTLDLSGTDLSMLSSPNEGQTHITKVDLDDCTRLSQVAFERQEFCTEFSALGCLNLNNVDLRNGAFKTIRLSLKDSYKDYSVRAFGNGCVGFSASQNGNNSPSANLYAYKPENADSFVGWYLNGTLLTTSLGKTVYIGGDYIAVFGGDANGDGRVDSSDALVALRAALGVWELDDINAADIDGDGAVGAADALLILRFAQGIY